MENSLFASLIDRSMVREEDVLAGDYYSDGLLFCGKCRTKKETVITLHLRDRDEKHKVRCMCRCEAGEHDAEERRCLEEQLRRRHLEMRSRGFADPRIALCRFENDDGQNADIMRVARNYLDHFPEFLEKGKGLLLSGAVGTGKTFAAACIVNALTDRLVSCRMTGLTQIVRDLRASEHENEVLDELCACDLMVLDDLGIERDTGYMNEVAANVIDMRYRSRKPLIVTTNLTPMELKNPSDVNMQRTASRLLEMCVPFEVKGPDRRREKLKREYIGWKRILEGNE